MSIFFLWVYDTLFCFCHQWINVSYTMYAGQSDRQRFHTSLIFLFDRHNEQRRCPQGDIFALGKDQIVYRPCVVFLTIPISAMSFCNEFVFTCTGQYTLAFAQQLQQQEILKKQPLSPLNTLPRTTKAGLQTALVSFTEPNNLRD